MSPNTMKAVRQHEFGGPEVLRNEDAPVPELKPGEVLVRVHAVGINPPDWYLREGYRTRLCCANSAQTSASTTRRRIRKTLFVTWISLLTPKVVRPQSVSCARSSAVVPSFLPSPWDSPSRGG